ncbi:hypothetical protein [Streptosporangium sp. NPDC051022]|uniref:hypothetical protein n=1 Tax=Streptosporangium sp. NPDC051022 TaxID=3155752 RepID=UPI0034264A03
MNGPEHYRAAEQLLSTASFVRSPEDPTPVMDPAVHAALVARAQVHATLALAAATALTGSMAAQSYTDEPELRVWHEVAGVPEDVEVSDAR